MWQGRGDGDWPFEWPYGRQRTGKQPSWTRRLIPVVIAVSLIALVICAAGPLGQRARAWAMERAFRHPDPWSRQANAHAQPRR